MSPKVFLDTNILLDLILQRPGYEHSAEILQAASDGKINCCISILSMANIAYVLRKYASAVTVAPTLKQISSLMEVLPMDAPMLQDSIMMDGPDFEDTLQAVCAGNAGCSYIVTHDTKGFRISAGLGSVGRIPEVVSPEEFLLSME